MAIRADAIERCPLRGPRKAEPFRAASCVAVRPLAEHIGPPGVQFNNWSSDCGRLLAPKIAGPEARAARRYDRTVPRPPLRGLENVQSPVSATRTVGSVICGDAIDRCPLRGPG